MISREDFMESQEVFDVLKFRAGFGITGSLPTDPYMFSLPTVQALELGTLTPVHG